MSAPGTRDLKTVAALAATCFVALLASGCQEPAESDAGVNDLGGPPDAGPADTGAPDSGAPSDAGGVAPRFEEEPADRTVKAGESATFQVRAQGEPTPNLRWERSFDGTNFLALPAATSTTYQTNETTVDDDGEYYRVVAENSAGRAISRAARLSIFLPAQVSVPLPVEAIVGSTVTFSVTAVGLPAPSLQWQRAEAATPDSFVDLPGANAPDYVTPPLTAADDGAHFRVRWSNRAADGSLSAQGDTPAAALTVHNALTAKHIVAGARWSLVIRPDGTVAGFGEYISASGGFTNGSDTAVRPVALFPGTLTDVVGLTGHGPEWWALQADGTVLTWGFAWGGSDGRGLDGSGSGGEVVSGLNRTNTTPVQVLERVLVGGVETAVPVSGVCQIASGDHLLLMVRAIDGQGTPTSCAPGAPKTLWYTGVLEAHPLTPPKSATVVRVPDGDLPDELDPDYAPIRAIYDWRNGASTTTLFFIVLENGRSFGLGHNAATTDDAFALPGTPSHAVVNGGPIELTAIWDTQAHPVRAAALGWFSAFVVRADGTLLSHGYATNGILGNGTVDTDNPGPTPVLAETCTQLPCADVLTGVTAVASDMGARVLVVKDGAIYGWGLRTFAVLGADGGRQLFPTQLGTAADFQAVALGETHALALRRDGAVFAWGNSSWGQNGEPNRQTLTEPTMVILP